MSLLCNHSIYPQCFWSGFYAGSLRPLCYQCLNSLLTVTLTQHGLLNLQAAPAPLGSDNGTVHPVLALPCFPSQVSKLLSKSVIATYQPASNYSPICRLCQAGWDRTIDFAVPNRVCYRCTTA